jgi:hypothetical protein
MKNTPLKFATLSGLLLVLNACTTIPPGPSVRVLPGSNKTFDQFRTDDFSCRQFALGQSGGTTANQASNEAGTNTAIAGTLIGAVIGAALGGNRGASIGAGVGLLEGSAIGANTAQRSAIGTQRQYDNAYIQCMYSYGHQVPGMGITTRRSAPRTTAAPEYYVPPPPPGYPAPSER